MLSYQVSTTIRSVVNESSANARFRNYVLPTFYSIADAVMVLLFLPVLNHLILPYFPLMSIKKRLGFGSFVNFLALGFAAYLQWAKRDASPEHRLLWYLIPVSLLALAELLVFVTGELMDSNSYSFERRTTDMGAVQAYRSSLQIKVSPLLVFDENN